MNIHEFQANIIFKDADPEAVGRGALRCFRNSGQSCNAPTRMLVEKSMYDEAIERLKKYTENFEVGGPKKEGEHIGPVISETQYNKIQTLIQKGIDEGAKRFGLDGGESLIPALEQIIKIGGQNNIKEVKIGMSHRGRLNVLANVLQKSYKKIFSNKVCGNKKVWLRWW